MVMTLQEEILDDLAKNMSQEIDNEVMCELLEEDGWHRVRANKKYDYLDIAKWVENNVTDRCHGYRHTWAFTQARDATAFLLVWS
jgi:hypothetical protein